MKAKLLRTFNVIFCMVILLYGSLAPSPIPGEGKSLSWQVFHNALHIPAYALLTLLLVLYFAVIPRPAAVIPNPKRRHSEPAGRGIAKTWRSLTAFGTTADLWVSAAIAMGYGILMEYLQSFAPGRYPSLMDVGLNAVGVGIVVVLFKIYKLQ